MRELPIDDIFYEDTDKVIRQLHESVNSIETHRRQLGTLAELEFITPAGHSISIPKSVEDGLRALSSPIVGDLHWQLMALENALDRLRSQLAYCWAYHWQSRLSQEGSLVSRLDMRWAEHYGFAVFVLYGIWNQLAHLLNALLAWGVQRKAVYPNTIIDQLGSDALRADDWAIEIARLYGALDQLRDDRNFEAHDSGQAHLVLEHVLDHLRAIRDKPFGEQGADARRGVLDYESARNGLVFEQWKGLLDSLRSLGAFLDRCHAAILVRHEA